MFGRRNNYLTLSVKEVNPILLEKMVNKAEKITQATSSSEPHMMILSSAIPLCFGPDVDVTKSRIAYGRWALPKLCKELHDAEPLTVRLAINTLCDLVHDPEKAYEALHLNIIKRIQDLCRSTDEFVRERCAMLLNTISGQAEGCNTILDDPEALHSLSLLLEDTESEVRFHAALAINTCASSFMGMYKFKKLSLLARIKQHDCGTSVAGAKVLTDAGFIPLLLARLLSEQDYFEKVHMETLKFLLDQDINSIATQLGAVETMTHLLGHIDPEISSNAAACLAVLATHWRGKCLAVKLEVLSKLSELLDSEEPEEQTKAAGAIMFITITTASRLQAIELELIPRLVELACDFYNQELQINCIKALTNIAEAPLGREILEQYKKIIENIQTMGESEAVGRHIKTLLDVIQWKP